MFLTVIRRAFRLRCPQCGKGAIFEGYSTLRKECPVCGLPLARREGDMWAFTYASLAFLTGVFLFFVVFVVRPANVLGAQIVLGLLALGVMFGTLPLRKSIGVALDYLVDVSWHNYEGFSLRPDAPGPDVPRPDQPG